MNFEVGKFYRTRNNKKVKLIHIGKQSMCIEFQCDETMLLIHNSGKYFNTQESTLDIIDEWKEEHTISGWVNIYRISDGKLWNSKILFATEKDALAHVDTKMEYVRTVQFSTSVLVR